jgi:HD superfamily phosphohydrolase
MSATGLTGIRAHYVDPVWGTNVRLTPLEQALLRTPPVRRLHLVAHAGGAALTTAQTYSRLEHSLGVLSLAAHLIPGDERLRAAALLHDIGHLPFSHTAEGIAGLDHHAIGISLLSQPEIREALAAHGVDSSDLVPLLDGRAPSALTPPRGLMGLDHLDSYVRSARFAARLHTDPSRLLAALDIRDGAVNCDRATAETLVDLVCAEARMHVSWDNLAPNAALRRSVQRLVDAGGVEPGRLARMTDAQLWAALHACEETREEAELLQARPYLLRVHAAGGPPAPGAWIFALRKIYSSAPTIEGLRVDEAAPELARRLDDLQQLPLAYQVQWDEKATLQAI